MTRTHAYTHVTTHGRELGRAEALLSVGHQAFNLAARASQPPEAGSRRPMSPSANHAPLEIIRRTLNSLTARLKHELTARIEHEPAFMHPNPNTQSLNPKSSLYRATACSLPLPLYFYLSTLQRYLATACSRASASIATTRTIAGAPPSSAPICAGCGGLGHSKAGKESGRISS